MKPKINNGGGNRNFGLDIIRAFAIITVVLIHGGSLILGHPRLLHLYSFLQIDGVTVFFVLSGFLIGGILLRTLNNNNFTLSELFRFWVRRWFRTLPTYYLILVFLIIARVYIIHTELPRDLIKYFFFFQNFTQPCTFEFYGVSWSLCVEEWFYLLIPILLFIAMLVFPQISKKKKILFCILFVILSVTLFRIYRIYTLNYDLPMYLKVQVQVIARLDSIMFGVLGAFLYFYKIPIWEKYQNMFCIAGILIILCSTYFALPVTTLFTIKPLGTLFILPKLSGIKSTNWKGAKLVTFISLISYSMYLLHAEVVMGVMIPPLCNLLHLNMATSIAVIIIKYLMYWILTLAVSYLVYRYFEKPMTNLRDKMA